MAQQKAISVENSFIKGLVTEATGLNFPEAAVTDTDNCVYEIDGSVYRRSGFDLEDSYTTLLLNKTDKAITTYLWQNVAGNGNLTVLVQQVSDKLYFYETQGTGIFSPNIVASNVTLTAVAGAPVVDTIEAQFSDGNGYLIVTHPYCEPMRISYDQATHTATPTNIIIKIRDFEGAAADPYALDERPTSDLASLNVNHKYNLYNQGWNTTNLTAWDAAQITMPSNADVMWRFKDSSDNFDASTASISRPTLGNTPAPNGHFVLNLSNQDRNTASGLSGIVSTTTNFQRPSVCAFFAGRAFYAGINVVGFNSKIYFTQIIENISQYGDCFQVNDPTSQDLFDELPSDGGVISIPEAGTIHKMFTVPGGLCVFASNGVWFLTGSTGLGFTAVDYAQLKIADISTLSPTSFVNVSGYPAWWNSEGIYTLVGGNNLPSVKSLTYDTFKTFYDDIPISSKAFARGFYNKTDGIIRWLYRSTSTEILEEIYEFDNILNHNLRTGAFYPWSISDSDVKVHGIVSTELITRAVSSEEVIDDTEFVVDASGNQVIAFGESIVDSPQFDKYIVSFPQDNKSAFTFADRNNDNLLDWIRYDDEGVDYTSYLVTGFKLRGQAARKFQNNWIDIYSRLDSPVSYYFQGIWDFANNSTNTGRWSTKQYVTHSNQNYSNAKRRLKVRGHGVALQFKVSSITGQPFDIIGWSSLQSVNSEP